jgi:hypothetical protein
MQITITAQKINNTVYDWYGDTTCSGTVVPRSNVGGTGFVNGLSCSGKDGGCGSVAGDTNGLSWFGSGGGTNELSAKTSLLKEEPVLLPSAGLTGGFGTGVSDDVSENKPFILLACPCFPKEFSIIVSRVIVPLDDKCFRTASLTGPCFVLLLS